ncbi:hypothetical protein Sjap_011150 [Stephania japonica]|uniref:Cytochrome P450 n=1 Tax=Stephania japonica TaxID=461633 RepID=A0AAP0JAY5_9MAGN
MEYLMASLLVIILSVASWLLFMMHFTNSSRHNGVLTNWPIFGMLPSLLLNLHRFHDWSTCLLARSGGTFVFKGPWFTNLNMVWTCDPANVHHIATANFANFPKGPEFKEMFDILGNGIFNADSLVWVQQRKIGQALISHSQFLLFLKNSSWNMDVIHRFAFDMTCSWTTGTHLGCLSIKLEKIPVAVAIDDAFKAILKRHYIPKVVWKFQRWLGVGSEKEIMKARKVLDEFICECISRKCEQAINESKDEDHNSINGYDLLSMHMKEDKKSDKYLRDFVLTYLIAGSDGISVVLTWFFLRLSQNPYVEGKIIEELRQNSPTDKRIFGIEVVGKLVYLHAALCESLRLFPPVWIEHKSSIDADVLPSGHRLSPKDKVMIFTYSMGRMRGIWGEDCLEFKPERWISDRGRIKYQPSYKFTAFHAGPRTCLGKDMAFNLMKMVVATLLYNYQFELEKGYSEVPKLSLGLYKENGLLAKIKRRVL